MRGIGPVIACYGGRDRIFGKAGARLGPALASTGGQAEIHEFPTVGHSFLTDGDHPVLSLLSRPFFHVRYDAEIAEDAWGRILSFFETNL